MTKGKRGGGKEHLLLWEELPYLKVEPTGKPVAIYKREDVQKELPLEQKNYYAHFPIRGTRGKRKSLLVTTRSEAEMRAQEEVVSMRVQLQQGVTLVKTTVGQVVEKFLKHKKSRVRDEWEGKQEAGRKTITPARYGLIRGKLLNYLVPFLGEKTDIKSIPRNKWSEWETWRRNNCAKGSSPKADTLLNEMGHIRELWRWAMNAQYIPASTFIPFADENLATNDKVRRDTWEPDEWESFKSKPAKWLREQRSKPEKRYWDCFVAYQMLFFMANNGMRVGEVVKVRRGDVTFYERDLGDMKTDKGSFTFKQLCCYVKVHKSTKTGEREVNSMGGKFAMNAYEKSPHKKKTDFLFQHLDGTAFTTHQFRDIFNDILAYTGEMERIGKHLVPYSLRHLYATTRILEGTSDGNLSKNMGVGQTYLHKHYDHSYTRQATDDLMKMGKSKSISGRVLKEGEDFLLDDA